MMLSVPGVSTDPTSGSVLWCDHPGQEALEARKCGQAVDQTVSRELELVTWPPLRLARMRRERESVGVVLPVGSRRLNRGGLKGACHRMGYPPRLRRSGG